MEGHTWILLRAQVDHPPCQLQSEWLAVLLSGDATCLPKVTQSSGQLAPTA